MTVFRSDFWHKYGSYVIAAAITLVAWAPVLFHGGFIMHGDLAYDTTLQNLQANYFPLWDQHPSMSNFDEIDRILIIQPLLWIAEVLHIGVGPFSRLFPFFVSLFGALGIVYSMRVLRSTVLESPGEPSMAAEILAVVLFSLNPWALFRVEAPYYQMAYNLTPVFVALQIRYLFTGRVRYALLAVVCWTLASGSPQYTVFTAIVSLIFLLLVHNSPKSPSWTTLFFRYCAILLGYGVLNLYWIGAFFDINRVSLITPGYELRWVDVQGFSQKSTFFNVISGLDMWVEWWKVFNPFASGVFDTIANVARPSTFIFVVIVALLNWKKLFFQYAIVVTVVLVLLLEGARGPIAPLYQFMVFHLVPGYGWIIRAPEKFGAFLWIFYTWIIGLGVDQISLRISRLRTAMISCAVGLVSLIAFFPVIYSTLLARYIPIPIPQAYMQVWDKLEPLPGKVMLVADYENLGQYNSGDAIFTWAPENMAGAVAPRSFPIPTFGVYHFTNPFNYFYDFVKAAGPENLSGLAAIVGTRYVALERDVVGDDAWYVRWKHALLQQHAKMVLENEDFAVFEIPGVSVSEVRTGPYAVLAGDLDALLPMIKTFGTRLGDRNLFLLEQVPSTETESLVMNASLLLLDNRTLADVASDTLMGRYGVARPAATGATPFDENWAFERLAYRFETSGGFWGGQSKGMNIHERLLDSDEGVLATSAKGAAFSLRLKGRATVPQELYVRMYVPPRRAPSAFHVVTPATSTYLETFSAKPKWSWFKVATFKTGAPLQAFLYNDYGLSIFSGAILVPRGTVQQRVRALQSRFAGRIVSNVSQFDLRRWPAAATVSTVLPGSRDTFNAGGSAILNETYDPLWICRGKRRDAESIPAWGFENGCAPIYGPMHFFFVSQESVMKWFAIEGIVVLILGIALAIRHNRKPHQTER